MLTLKQRRVEVSELSERFGVTTETIRRDLSELQIEKLVRRVHGGAVPWEQSVFEPLLSVRNVQHDAEKHRLAIRALNELPDAGSIMIDSGSTLSRFAQVIPNNTDLRVVTNSLTTAQILAEANVSPVFVIGGEVRTETLAMVDASAVAAIAPLTVDTLFISSDGASVEIGLSTFYAVEASVKQAMIAAARRVIALVDHSKIGTDHLFRFAEWSDVDVLITNSEVDPAVVAAIEATGTVVALA